MADDPVLKALRDHLVDEQIVRRTREAGGLPPLWLAPRNGVPAPGEPEDATANQLIERHPDLVVGAYRATGIPSPRHEGFIDRAAVELRIRARTEGLATALHRQLRGELHDRRAWLMGGLRVEESLMFRDLQPIVRDRQGFTYTTEFIFEIWDQTT